MVYRFSFIVAESGKLLNLIRGLKTINEKR